MLGVHISPELEGQQHLINSQDTNYPQMAQIHNYVQSHEQSLGEIAEEIPANEAQEIPNTRG
jgi:hypothetical protein